MNVVVVSFITFILLLSVCFELGHEHLKETTPEAFQPILTSLYSELTLLGFIGLLMFTIFKAEYLHTISTRIFGEPEEIQELGEQVHMVLFLVMAIFLAQAVGLARFGESIQRKWHVWEAKPIVSDEDKRNGCSELRAIYHKAKNRISFLELLVTNHMPDKYRLILHTAARLRFVEESGLAATDFEFARYLSTLLGHTLGELVEVPIKTWFVLEIILLFFWQCELHLPPNARLSLWISTGYLTAFLAYLVHAKLRLVLHEYCAPFVGGDTSFMKQIGDHGFSTLVLPSDDVGPCNPMDETRERSPSLAHPNISGVDVVESACNRVKRLAKQRRASMAATPSISTTISRVKNSMRESIVNTSRPKDRQAVVPIVDSISSSYPTRARQMNDPAPCAYDNVAAAYVASFWFGETQRAHFTFDIIRLICLMTAVYMAIFCLVYVDDLFETHKSSDRTVPAIAFQNRGGCLGGAVILLLAIGPPALVLLKITRVLEDFTVVANISDMKNRRVIELVLRRQKTVAAFEALKVVQCLRNPSMLLKVIASPKALPEDEVLTPQSLPSAASDIGRGSGRFSWSTLGFSISQIGDESETEMTSSEKKTWAAAQTTTGKSIKKKARARRASVAALSELRREERDIFASRQRSHWQRIFNLFDEDGEGSIDRGEMRNLLLKFACDATSEQLDSIIDNLDDDNSGEISFDEFFSFATKLTRYVASCDPDELVHDMFKLLDQDASGTITVHEMHNVVHEMLGQDLSVEDVFNVVQDIDVDGNGELDLEEFSVLLERFGIYH